MDKWGRIYKWESTYSALRTELSCYSQQRVHLSCAAEQSLKCSGQKEESVCCFSQNKADTEDSCNTSRGKVDSLLHWQLKKSYWWFFIRCFCCSHWNFCIMCIIVASWRKYVAERGRWVKSGAKLWCSMLNLEVGFLSIAVDRSCDCSGLLLLDFLCTVCFSTCNDLIWSYFSGPKEL